MPQLDAWLARLELARYADLFAAHEVDFSALQHFSDSDLKELGLPLGPRRKIIAALAEITKDELRRKPKNAGSRREA